MYDSIMWNSLIVFCFFSTIVVWTLPEDWNRQLYNYCSKISAKCRERQGPLPWIYVKTMEMLLNKEKVKEEIWIYTSGYNGNKFLFV